MPSKSKRMEAVDKETDAVRYPYSHHGPAVFGSKLADFLISEIHLREDYPELFNDKESKA